MFGSWLVQEKLSTSDRAFCVCTSCGKTTKTIRIYDLVNNRSRMCRSCSTKAKRETHGMSNTPEYNTWVHMNQRCYNPTNKDYKNYGGRGIKICTAWRDSFEAFFMSVGAKPEPADTIERLDYNKGYFPGNVKWASRQEQVLNKGDNINLEIDGVTKTVSQWAKEAPVSCFTIYKRVARKWLPKYGAKATVFTPSGKAPNGITLK